MSEVQLILADYENPAHASALVGLLNTYAEDPMGGGNPLPTKVQECLVGELRKRPFAFSVLAFEGDQAVGLANCFEGFSTFRCQPLINVHDMVVMPCHRGRGIAQRLLHEVELRARAKGCCKITLEVLQGNPVAQQAYRKAGFAGYELDPAMGQALFWEKLL